MNHQMREDQTSEWDSRTVINNRPVICTKCHDRDVFCSRIPSVDLIGVLRGEFGKERLPVNPLDI